MLVIDASVMVKLATAEPDSTLAIDAVLHRDDCVAPDLLLVELASALGKKVRFNGLPLVQALQGFDVVLPLLAEIVESKPLLEPSIRLSAQLDHSLFGCLYLALAIERNCAMLTADMKFATKAAAGGYGVNVQTLR